MAQRINAAVVINPINLVAMAIVPSPRHALDERALLQQIEWLRVIASRLPCSPNAVLTAVEPAAAVAKALKLGFATRVAHPLGDIIAIPDRLVSTLNYLRNNVLHAFALPALVANLLIALREATPERVAEFAEGALPFLRAELMLRHTRDEAIAESGRIVQLFVEMGLARSSPDGKLRAAARYSSEHGGLELLARSLRHLLRRNYLTIALVTQVGAGKLERERLEELMQMLTQRLSMLFEFAPPDFYERSTFASYIDTLLETGLIREDADGSLSLHEHSRTWEHYVERLLPPDAVLAIRRVAADRAPPAAASSDPVCPIERRRR
jgi:glycerol-3-phosphate O-acyltransferase